MLTFDPREQSVRENHQLLLNFVAPRPIALVSTISGDGINNLSPFSFFNAFGANPPMVAFSPARRGRDNTVKDTYTNLNITRECVIHAVTYDILEQINLASAEFPSDTDEIEIAGFTTYDSDIVKPKRIKESPFHMECKLHTMLELGGKNGSGNLAVCEVVKFHVAEDLWRNGKVDPDMIDLMGRNGGNYYTRASGEAILELDKPTHANSIGYKKLPEYIKSSHLYTANNIGRFALTDHIPTKDEVIEFIDPLLNNEAFYSLESFYRFEKKKDYENMLKAALFLYQSGEKMAEGFFRRTAKIAIEDHNDDFAWKVAVFDDLKNDSDFKGE